MVWRKIRWNAFVLWHARHERALPYWPLERIERVQRRRLQRMVRHAFREAPHYRETAQRLGLEPEQIRSAEDLKLLPMVSKAEYAAAPERFQSERLCRSGALRIDSSGTSGRSKPVYHDPESLFLAMAHGRRQAEPLRRFLGRTTRYRELIAARPGGVHTQIRRFYEANLWMPRFLDLERAYLPVSGTSAEEQAAFINRFRPDMMWGYGTLIGGLFRRIARRRLKVWRPKVIAYGGDAMPEADRELIEGEFGIPVFSIYQAVEALHIGFQCELRRGLHLFTDSVIVRIVDEEGRDLAPGETGDIVISNLTNRATVFLNYRLGDLGRLGAEPCPCGRTLPVLESLEGRDDDMVALPSGAEVHALVAIEELRAVPGVVQVQLRQEALSEFVIRAVPRPATERDRAAAELKAALRRTLGTVDHVAVEWYEEIPPDAGGKTKAVVSRCLARAGSRASENDQQAG